MIQGLGIDSVEIERFKDWHTYSQKSLLRIFPAAEIEYCLSNPAKSAERFAARFAAREAFLKALHQALPAIKIPLLTACKAIELQASINGAPQAIINWHRLRAQEMHCLFSWAHNRTTATAIVIVQEK